MLRHRTFAQQIGAGFTLTVFLVLGIVAIAIYSLNHVVAAKDAVISVNAQLLINAERLRAGAETKGGSTRGFLLTGEERFLDQMRREEITFIEILGRLRQAISADDERRLVDDVERYDIAYQQAIELVIALRRTEASIDSVAAAFSEQVVAKRDELDRGIDAFVSKETTVLHETQGAATSSATFATRLIAVLGGAAVIAALLIATVLTRTLGRQIGAAVGQVRSSSAELQATANQQATGSKEQATAMSEIATTISELLVTSRQIAESAQRVAHIASETGEAARSGEDRVEKATELTLSIRRQVDLVVNQVLDLGKKSQQIGSVLDIVSELAEQTNILAINATIEAAGAGESGKRFAVVADEIRKLADRVAGSTKEIRALIDGIRSSVNTTVMATETGSKAVDSGARQFKDVAASFKQIAGLVTTTTGAAREIELSTKQQMTAVEQVNVAISNVAQTTKETEVGSNQTLQTATQLASLSRDLLQLVRPKEAA